MSKSKSGRKKIEFTATYKNEENTQGMNKKFMSDRLHNALILAEKATPPDMFLESITGTDGSMWYQPHKRIPPNLKTSLV